MVGATFFSWMLRFLRVFFLIYGGKGDGRTMKSATFVARGGVFFGDGGFAGAGICGGKRSGLVVCYLGLTGGVSSQRFVVFFIFKG